MFCNAYATFSQRIFMLHSFNVLRCFLSFIVFVVFCTAWEAFHSFHTFALFIYDFTVSAYLHCFAVLGQPFSVPIYLKCFHSFTAFAVCCSACATFSQFPRICNVSTLSVHLWCFAQPVQIFHNFQKAFPQFLHICCVFTD